MRILRSVLTVALLALAATVHATDTTAKCHDLFNLACASGTPSTQDIVTQWNIKTGSNTELTFDGLTGDTNKITLALVGDPAASFTARIPHDADSAMAKTMTSTAGQALTAFDAATGTFTKAATSVLWDAIGNPSGNQALTMGNTTSTWTWSTATGAATNTFVIKDTTANTGTGYLLDIHSVGTSAMKPLTVTAGGTANGVDMTTAGLLEPIGTGGIKASIFTTGSTGALAGGIKLDICTSSPCTTSVTPATADHVLVFLHTMKFRRATSCAGNGVGEYTVSGSTVTLCDSSSGIGSGVDSAQILTLS